MQKSLYCALAFIFTATVGFAATGISKRSPSEIVIFDQSYRFEVTGVEYSGAVYKNHVMIQRSSKSSEPLDFSVLKQRALWTEEIKGGLGAANNFIIYYVAPDAIDGRKADQDALILNLPKPAFWRDEQGHWTRTTDCNVMLEVTLHSSGMVSKVRQVPLADRFCSDVGDVVRAAEDMQFRPAKRDGKPITERQLFFYRLH